MPPLLTLFPYTTLFRSGEGSRIVPIIRSRDLVQWEYRGTAFEEMPGWKEKGGIWAPCIAEVDGQYYLYYSYSVWADPDPGVGRSEEHTSELQSRGQLVCRPY